MMRESGPSRAAGKSRSWHASRPTHLCLEGEHGDGKAQEETPCRADRRLGAARASLRMGRAEGVREDQAARPVRRAAPRAGVADRNLREDALPQNLGLRTTNLAIKCATYRWSNDGRKSRLYQTPASSQTA